MIQLQYDLFEEIPDEMMEVRQGLIQIKQSQEKQRKALFGRQHELMKMMIEQKEEIHRLKFEIDSLRKIVNK